MQAHGKHMSPHVGGADIWIIILFNLWLLSSSSSSSVVESTEEKESSGEEGYTGLVAA